MSSSDSSPYSSRLTPYAQPLGVYIHIPYCLSRCHYCDFNSYRIDTGQITQYLETLAREIASRACAEAVRDRRVCSVFFGGGTPSILQASQLVGILDHCRATFTVEDDAEVSLEVNPGTVDLPKLCALREGGGDPPERRGASGSGPTPPTNRTRPYGLGGRTSLLVDAGGRLR
ncbi:MAG: hypothetical protein M5R38_11165 [Candidatus Methylomirabilis sp.]|nr:hypothetical protein [Candidatus Methylomirabilis sp.]